MLQILRKKRNYESQFDPPPPTVVFPKIIFHRKGYSPVPNNKGGGPTDNLNINKQGGLNRPVYYYLEPVSKPWFLVTFNIIISHIFPEKFRLNCSSRSEVMKIFSININYFYQFFGIFDILLFTFV